MSTSIPPFLSPTLGIGNFDLSEKEVHIIGAGISGLLAGYALKKSGYSVHIYEATARAGGLIQTKTSPYGMVETAAHSLLVTRESYSFLKEIGVDLVPVNANSKARYILRNGSMKRMPLTLLEIFSTLKHIFSKPKMKLDFETATLEDFGNQYLGRAATQFLLSPFVTGIFATEPNKLNAVLSFPKLIPGSPHISFFQFMRSKKRLPPHQMNSPITTEKKIPLNAPKDLFRSSRPVMMAPLHGTNFLIEKLNGFLKEEIVFNHPIHTLENLKGNVIFSTPAEITSKIIFSEDSAASKKLSDTEYAPLITTTVFVREEDFIHHPPRGVGVLIPRSENIRILGCLFNSSSFPNRAIPGWTSLTVMIGGTTDPTCLSLTDAEIKSVIERELSPILKIKSNSVQTHQLVISRWPNAIPIYSTKLKNTLEFLRTGYFARPKRVLFSNYSGTVAVRGLIESII